MSSADTLTPETYTDFLSKEYLGDFVRHGGGSVKFAVAGDDEAADELHVGLGQIAESNGYVYAQVDAITTKVHMVDHIFFTIARQINWDGLAADFVRSTWEELSLPAPPPYTTQSTAQRGSQQRDNPQQGQGAGEHHDGITVTTVAEHYQLDRRELYRSVRRHLESSILGDHVMSHEFRLAMMRLCQFHLDTGDVNADEHAAVLDWLRGELRQLSRLRSSLIFQHVGRHNAHRLFLSTAHWLARITGNGLLVDVDLARLAAKHRPPVECREGIYYSKAATLDAYEVLRQMVDATDDLASCLIVVVTGTEFLTDEKRGLAAYTALHLRLADEVRDKRRVNPFAALVRVGLNSAPVATSTSPTPYGQY